MNKQQHKGVANVASVCLSINIFYGNSCDVMLACL